MSSNSVWKISGDTATAAWKSSDRTRTISELIVPTNTPLNGARLKLGGDEVHLFTHEKIAAAESDPASEKRTDLYSRGDDVIMQFESESHPFERTIYWRAIEDNDAQDAQGVEGDGVEGDGVDGDGASEVDAETFAVELIYSLQTDELDTKPVPMAVSRLPIKSFKAYSVVGDSTDEARAWQMTDDLNQCQLICANLTGGAVLAIGVLPSDLERVEIESQLSPTPITFHLKSEFLEKGVIRRLRMFVCGGSGQSDESRVMQRATDFLNSQIPLTT